MRTIVPPTNPLSHDEYKRQSRAIESAVRALPTKNDVCEFLNSHHEGLGGRPLDLAIESHSGLLAVEAALLWDHGAKS